MIMRLFQVLQRFSHSVIEQICSPQFIRYFIVGCSAVILDIATLYFLKAIIGLSAVWSIVINQVLLCSYVFLLNKYWVFATAGAFTRQAVRYFSLAAANYLIAIVWMWLFNGQFGFNYLFVRLFNIALSTAWNFLLYRFFVYTQKQVSLE